MVNDPVADMLARINNGYLARHQAVTIPHSRIKEKIAKILVKEGYLKSLKIEKAENSKLKTLVCQLTYQNGQPSVSSIKRISKPGKRVYRPCDHIPWTISGYGITLISTTAGVMTDREARKKKLGGEIICQIY